MRRLFVLLTIFAAAIPLCVVESLSPASEAAVLSGAPTPIVVGSRLIDSRTNAVFTPHGVNWPSFEYACWQGWGYSSSNSAKEALAMATWGVNTVRLPLNQDCWLGLQGSPASGTAAGYRAAVHSWVGTLHSAGIVAILDLHSTAPAGYPAHGQRAMPDAQSTTFWSSVASEFTDDPSVLFDLFNEPYSRWNDSTNSWTFYLTWECWRNGGCEAPVEDDYTSVVSGASYPVTGMATLVAAVRDAGARQPILLGGLDYSNDLRGWLANAPDDDQLVASWHNYPGQRCSTVTCWNSEIAPVAAAVPVVTGEFGETDGGSSFLTSFMTWADSRGVGYLPWAWWKVSASESVANSRYALVEGADFTPKAPSGTAFHDHLASIEPRAPGALSCPIVRKADGSIAACPGLYRPPARTRMAHEHAIVAAHPEPLRPLIVSGSPVPRWTSPLESVEAGFPRSLPWRRWF
ncbi:MAG: cellulase family glycosylhydrolase [Cryobacterium sp.]|nr:cellulase family glycosylhydrolase [Cryobacterium sp.]